MADQNNPTPNQNQLFDIFLELLAEPDFQALVAAVKPQHLEFLLSYLDSQSPGWRKRNKAAELAGYAAGKPGSAQLSVQGSRVLKNPNVQQCMAAVFERAGCTLERDAKVISEAMTATRTRYLRGANNTIISTPAEPDHATRLRAVAIEHCLLRTPSATATHQRLPAVDSEATTSAEHVCPNCGEAMSKVAAFNPADRGLLRAITKCDQELANSETPQQHAGEEDGDSEAPGKNSC